MRFSLRRFVGVMFVALAFGVAVAVLKGNGAGIRQTIGNTSAPWLLLPFIAGAVAGQHRPGPAALIGTSSTFVALVAFYVANTFVLDLGPHPWVVDLHLAVDGGKRYFALALMSGPIFGALGGLWQRARSVALGVLVASLLIFEPLAWLVYERGQPLASYNNYPLVWVIEAGVGLCACVIFGTLTHRPGRHAL